MLLCHHGNIASLPVNCFQASPRPLDENKLNRNYGQRAKTASFQSPERCRPPFCFDYLAETLPWLFGGTIQETEISPFRKGRNCGERTLSSRERRVSLPEHH